ncbi:MAG: lyase family protein, partial [Microthrixaceae bacterium]
LPLGGTAVGTGLNAPPGFADQTIRRLSQVLGLNLYEAKDHFEAQGGQDSLVECSGALRVVAVSMNKIANDLRWMSSGPHAGLGEISLPALQPGSSIMPGKINPIIPEVVQQVVAQVIGNDAAIGFAGASGNFELNVMMPVIGRNLLGSIDLLSSAARSLAEKVIPGIQAHETVLLAQAESSGALITALVPLLGYEIATSIAQLAETRGTSIKEELARTGELSAAQVKSALNVLNMTRGGIHQ